MHWFKHLIFILLILPALSSTGQSMYYHHINTNNGAPSNNIFDLETDNDGYLYIGTINGLFKYNGFHFTEIPIKNAIGQSITNIEIVNDKISCTNFSDQVFYESENGLSPIKGLSQYLVNETLLNKRTINDKIYVAGNNNLFIIDAETLKVINRIKINDIENIKSVGETLIITQIDGTISFFKDGIIKKQIKLDRGKYKIAGDNDKIFIIDNYNQDEEIIVLRKNYEIDTISVKLDRQISIINLHYIDEMLVISSNNGTFFHIDNEWVPFITGQIHTCIVKDFQGGFWISTLDDGLIYLPSLKINLFMNNPDFQYLRQIINSPNGYFISTNKGEIYEVDKKGNKLKTFNSNTGLEIEFLYYHPEKRILYTSQGHFNYDEPEEHNHFYYGKNIAFDENDNLFFGIHNKSGVITSEKDILVKVPMEEMQSKQDISFYPIRNKRTRTLEYSNETLYISYIDQLLIYNKNGEIELKTDEGYPIFATKMTTDDKGNMWIATNHDGVFCVNNGKITHHFNADNGLLSNSCLSLDYSDNKLYVVLTEGVNEINLIDFTIKDFSNEYPINLTDVRDILADEKRIFLLTKNGLLSVEKTKHKQNTDPLLIFKSITNINNSEIENKNDIPYKNNSININWDFINFKQVNNNNLMYRLKGLNENWIKISPSTNTVLYNNLPNKNYTFEIKVDNSPHIYSQSFSIQKPYWKTWWFSSLSIIASSLILFSIVQLTSNIVERRQRLRELLVHSQLTALRSQMNPHFLYNALNSIQGLIYSNKTNEAGTYVSMFSDHLRHTLDISSKQWIKVKDEINSLETYLSLEKLRFGEDFNYIICKADEVDENIRIPSMIIQPYVENAVKHGLLHKPGYKNIEVLFEIVKDKTLKISITDNGIGRKKSYLINQKRKDKPRSFATHAINTRIELINERYKNPITLKIVDIEEDTATGTAVYLWIEKNLYTNEDTNS